MSVFDVFIFPGIIAVLAFAYVLTATICDEYQTKKKEKQDRKKLGALYWYWKNRVSIINEEA
jgi:hypothetical protein